MASNERVFFAGVGNISPAVASGLAVAYSLDEPRSNRFSRRDGSIRVCVSAWNNRDPGTEVLTIRRVTTIGVQHHDCGHGSFFRPRLANDWVGRVIGVLTLTPYDFWRRAHALHHASSGNLDRRGIGDIDTLTVREFLALPKGGRLLYRLYRHPLVMFGVGPAYLFIFQHRLPMGLTRNGWQPWLSAMATNVAIAVLLATMVWLVGFGPFLLVQLPITLFAASIGVWLFYIQHQFEDTFWAHNEKWNFHEAGLYGSSYYELPIVLRWFTANIGVHHVHHLCSRIPYYRLPQVLKDYPQLSSIGRLTLVQSFRCVRKVLWDEDRHRLVSFREMASTL